MDNRDLSFSSIKNNSPKFLSTKDIDKYNLDGFVAPFNAFSNSEMIKIRKSVDELFLKLESYNDGRDSYSINCYQHKSKTIWNIINNEKILNHVEDLNNKQLKYVNAKRSELKAIHNAAPNSNKILNLIEFHDEIIGLLLD